MDATITEVAVEEKSLSITFKGEVATTEKPLREIFSKTEIHRVFIQSDSPDEVGAFQLLTDKAKELTGKVCTLDIETSFYSYRGGCLIIQFSSSKVDIKEHANRSK